VVIDGKSGTVIENVRISSSTGECVTIRNSQNITIRNSNIGPCGRNAIRLQGSSSIKIVDNYLHTERRPAGCCDTNDGVFASGASGVLIQGNVVAFNETNIELQSSADVNVIGNYLLNPLGPFPRGQQVQSWNNSRNITVEDNYAVASTDTSKYPFAADQEDAINFGFTDGITARNNYVTGGDSPSGCGIITDQASNNAKFVNNVLVRTGQCGIGLGNGSNLVADGNKIFNNTAIAAAGAGNTALYVWSPSAPCGPVQVTNNIIYGVKPNGSVSSYWDGGGCGNVTYAGNIGGQEAFNLLTPEAQKLPAPAIPPKPYSGVAPAPYIN
jgi:Right handed beta helix region